MASQFVSLPVPAGSPPSGAAGGDLTGTYPNPQLANTITARNDLGVFTAAPVFTTVNFAASPYTILSTDQVLAVDTSGGAVTLNAPDPSLKRSFIVIDSTGSFGTNSCTLARFGSEKISNLTANFPMSGTGGSYAFGSDGTNYWRTGARNAAFKNFTTTTTWTCPATTFSGIATGRAAYGGGGGGAAGGGGSTATAGGGGGSGGPGSGFVSRSKQLSLTPGVTYTITIGTLGAGGSGATAQAASPSGVVGLPGNSGTPGGTSSFDTLITFQGGGQGIGGGTNATFSSAGAAAAVPSGYEIGNIPGAAGGAAGANGVRTTGQANTNFGLGGTSGVLGSSGGAGGGGGGGAGSGSSGGDSTSTAVGGNGGAGAATGVTPGSNGTDATTQTGQASGAGGGGGGGGGVKAATGSAGGNGGNGSAGGANGVIYWEWWE